MKINSLQISNILSFKYFEDVSRAAEIIFDKNLNIVIGENGAGKSTALEVMNFIFKRVLFTRFEVNQESFFVRDKLTNPDKKNILSAGNDRSYSSFRLERNWDTNDKPQVIRLCIELDEVDFANLRSLAENKEKLNKVASTYTTIPVADFANRQKEYFITIALNDGDKTFSSQVSPNGNDAGYLYLVNYNFYRDLINLHNIENPADQIPTLHESFVLIGGYRNYHVFNPSISLKDSHPAQQIRQLKNQEHSKSINTTEQSEPSVFNLVRLLIAEKHFDLFDTKNASKEECEKEANKLSFLVAINEKLKLVNLECKIRLIEARTWQYAFEFVDTKRNKVLSNINSLSAGQKAIIHLIFEAYGRGSLKGGLVIIDEPEIHLHYQFQNEYLRIIEAINEEQKCQYILVTHSESLINSETINKVRRFSLNDDRCTVIKSPTLSTEQKYLIKILDNTRSTHAFFGRKVVLVEGEDDRYFFKSVLQKIYPELVQEITILDIQGKGKQREEWKTFFEEFGLKVYFVTDLDSAFGFFYPSERACKLNGSTHTETHNLIAKFKNDHPDLISQIHYKYEKKIFILKNGALEHYLNIHQKGLPEIIEFCDKELENYLKNDADYKSQEIRFIMSEIVK